MSSQSDHFSSGRRLVLTFAPAKPQLAKIEFRFDGAAIPIVLDRGTSRPQGRKARGDRFPRLKWTKANQAFSLFWLHYVEWFLSERKGEFLFDGVADTAAATVATAVEDRSNILHHVIAESAEMSDVYSFLQTVICGPNRNTRDKLLSRELTVTDELPAVCVEVYQGDKKLTLHTEIVDLVRKVWELTPWAQQSPFLDSRQAEFYSVKDTPHHKVMTDAVSLHVAKDMVSEIYQLLIHPEFPAIMSLGGKFVINPIWTDMCPSKKDRFLKMSSAGDLRMKWTPEFGPEAKLEKWRWLGEGDATGKQSH